MATYIGQTFSGQDVTLDGNTFERCSFSQCRLVYNGGPGLPVLRNCLMSPDCRWHFDEAAGRTLVFLAERFRSGDRQVVQQVIDYVTQSHQGPPPQSSTVTVQ